jgi:hypothetical protein
MVRAPTLTTIPGQSMLRSVDVRKRSIRMSKHDLEARRI